MKFAWQVGVLDFNTPPRLPKVKNENSETSNETNDISLEIIVLRSHKDNSVKNKLDIIIVKLSSPPPFRKRRILSIKSIHRIIANNSDFLRSKSFQPPGREQ